MVQSLNGQAPSLPTDLLARDDDADVEAVAQPLDAPDDVPATEPEVEEGEETEFDPDDIDIVDDDADENEQPAGEEATAEDADPEADDPAWKREYRKQFARNVTAKVRQALRGELDPKSLNASERFIYKDLKSFKDEVEQPVRQSREESAWSEYQEMWQASIQNPQQFNEFWRDEGKRSRWLQMEQNRAVLGLHPGIDPQTFRERFNEYNAQFKEDGALAGTEVDEFYEELQDKRYWSDLDDAEKALLAPQKYSGTTTQVIAAMARQAALLEVAVKARKAKRPVEQRIAEVNKTATNAQKAAKGAPLGVVRGQRTSMTAQQIRELAAKGDPQGLKLYAKWKEKRKATA